MHICMRSLICRKSTEAAYRFSIRAEYFKKPVYSGEFQIALASEGMLQA
jgi:hypothetical protein